MPGSDSSWSRTELAQNLTPPDPTGWTSKQPDQAKRPAGPDHHQAYDGTRSTSQRHLRSEVGKRADLLPVGGNPLEDVAHIDEQRRGVMAAGAW